MWWGISESSSHAARSVPKDSSIEGRRFVLYANKPLETTELFDTYNACLTHIGKEELLSIPMCRMKATLHGNSLLGLQL